MRHTLPLLALALSSCAIVVDDDDQPWTSMSGAVLEADDDYDGESYDDGPPDTTACTTALDPDVVFLVEGHVECSYPYRSLCFSGDVQDDAANTVCCDGEEPGSLCEINPPVLWPIEQVGTCDEPLIKICDY
jgi:hypothetical protein